MKKRFLGTVLAAALVVSSAISVFALGSKTTAPTITGESAGKYEIVTSTEDKDEKEVFATMLEGTAGKLDAETAVKVVDQITELNKGEVKLAETILDKIAETAPEMTEEQVEELKTALENKELVTKLFDLTPIDGGIITEDGKYQVTLAVTARVEEMKDTDVKLLHYSTERVLWEVIDPEEVDFETKEITAKFDDLSPVAIIADETEEEKAE